MFRSLTAALLALGCAAAAASATPASAALGAAQDTRALRIDLRGSLGDGTLAHGVDLTLQWASRQREITDIAFVVDEGTGCLLEGRALGEVLESHGLRFRFAVYITRSASGATAFLLAEANSLALAPGGVLGGPFESPELSGINAPGISHPALNPDVLAVQLDARAIHNGKPRHLFPAMILPERSLWTAPGAGGTAEFFSDEPPTMGRQIDDANSLLMLASTDAISLGLATALDEPIDQRLAADFPLVVTNDRFMRLAQRRYTDALRDFNRYTAATEESLALVERQRSWLNGRSVTWSGSTFSRDQSLRDELRQLLETRTGLRELGSAITNAEESHAAALYAAQQIAEVRALAPAPAPLPDLEPVKSWRERQLDAINDSITRVRREISRR